ncbi:MAG: plasmid segregation centromere-binding protein ParR, partial [Nostoc sp.]
MFQWSKKVVKSVTFNPELADESLLAQVESYL